MTWLSLLLRDAPAAEFDQLRGQQIAAGDAPQHVDAELAQALQLQAQLRETGQRATEFAVLSEVAARLTSVRDLGGLLNDIAAQARRLLRTDVAYLALAEGGALRIKYFDGVLGPAMREVLLSDTAGLAGQIFSAGRPAWTSDYLNDTRIQHVPGADQLAVDEGLRSVLGVPLHSGAEVLGVLFAAERRERPFSDAEVTLLSGLAAHAAVALQGARLLEAERAAARELRAANEQLHANGVVVARAIALHERLTDAVVRGGGPADVVTALADTLGLPVQLVDANDRPLAGPDLAMSDPSAHFPHVASARTEQVPDEHGLLLLTPVVAAEDYLGCLVVRSSGPVDGSEVRLIERGALGIALALVQERAVLEVANRSQGDLLAALVEGGDSEVLGRRAAAARVNLKKPHVVLLLEPASGAESPARGAAAELARRHDGLVVDRAGLTLLLLPADAPIEGLAVHATVGVSEAVVGAAALPDAYAAARECLRALLALGRPGVVARPDDLGVYRFLLAPGGRESAAELIERVAGRLLEHDASRGTDLAGTLEVYYDTGRLHTTTAERLHIHSNTLYQRLGRISSLLGEGWREGDAALELHLALRLRRLSETLG